MAPWGYHALVLTRGEHRGETLSVVNRSGIGRRRRGGEQVDRPFAVCSRGGLRKILLRGDTKFAQTEQLWTRWSTTRGCALSLAMEATAI